SPDGAHASRGKGVNRGRCSRDHSFGRASRALCSFTAGVGGRTQGPGHQHQAGRHPSCGDTGQREDQPQPQKLSVVRRSGTGEYFAARNELENGLLWFEIRGAGLKVKPASVGTEMNDLIPIQKTYDFSSVRLKRN